MVFTAVYGNPHPSNREELWDKFDGWALRIFRPWLPAGDFNKTHSLDERDHGQPEMDRHYIKFSNWIETMR